MRSHERLSHATYAPIASGSSAHDFSTGAPESVRSGFSADKPFEPRTGVPGRRPERLLRELGSGERRQAPARDAVGAVRHPAPERQLRALHGTRLRRAVDGNRELGRRRPSAARGARSPRSSGSNGSNRSPAATRAGSATTTAAAGHARRRPPPRPRTPPGSCVDGPDRDGRAARPAASRRSRPAAPGCRASSGGTSRRARRTRSGPPDDPQRHLPQVDRRSSPAGASAPRRARRRAHPARRGTCRASGRRTRPAGIAASAASAAARNAS